MAVRAGARNEDVNKESTDRIKEHLKNNTFSRVYLFYGEETFLIDYFVNEIKKQVLGENDEGLNLSVFENKTDIEVLIDACDTFPLFADKKLVIVKNSGLFSAKGQKKTEAAGEEDGQEEEEAKQEQSTVTGSRAQEALSEYIPNIPVTTCLIFIENSVDKRLKVFKQVSVYGTVLEFKRNKPEYLVHWVIANMKKQLGRNITAEAAEYLVAVSDPDMYALRNEMFKLSAYAGDRKDITLEDVKQLAIPTIKSVIFDLLDAVAQRNGKKAIVILDDILSLKEPEQKIFAMLSKQAGELMKMKLLLESGASQADINRYFSGRHPYVIKKLTEQARRTSVKYLQDLLRCLMETEESYKKGLIGPRLAFEILFERLNAL